MAMEVGFVGLGNMGGAIARRLLRARPLTVFDLRPQAIADLAAAGAIPAAGLAEVAAACDVVIACLPTSDDVRAILFGDGGIAAGLRRGGVVIDMTTGDPAATRDMAERLRDRGIDLVDAPVSGGPIGAEAGTLAIMVGAAPALYERCRDLLSTVSPNVFHAGGTGNGHAMKLVNNTISAANRAIAFEAVMLGVRHGLDPKVCVDIVQKSSGRSFATEVVFPRYILTGAMDQGFTLGLMHKDLSLAAKLGADSGTPMRLADMVREIYRDAVARLGPDADICTLVRLYEEAAGVELPPLAPDRISAKKGGANAAPALTAPPVTEGA